MVFDPSNNVEFLVDTGSPISFLPVKDFASCDRYSGLQTLSAINNTLISIHGTKHLQVQLPTEVIHSYPWTFKVANVEMAILGCDFLAFHGLQLDFTEMLLVDPHVIGSHDERVIQGSRLNKAEERFPPQPSINEVENLSITRDINVLPAEKIATTVIGVGRLVRLIQTTNTVSHVCRLIHVNKAMSHANRMSGRVNRHILNYLSPRTPRLSLPPAIQPVT